MIGVARRTTLKEVIERVNASEMKPAKKLLLVDHVVDTTRIYAIIMVRVNGILLDGAKNAPRLKPAKKLLLVDHVVDTSNIYAIIMVRVNGILLDGAKNAPRLQQALDLSNPSTAHLKKH